MIDNEFIRVHAYEKNQKLFRYLQLEKLMFLFLQEGLPLIRLPLLGDPFEGSLPDRFVKMAAEERKDWKLKNLGGDTVPKEYLKDKKAYIEKRKNQEWQWRRNHFVSCWHANHHESEAMWQLYSHKQKGIAIQTDIGTLARTLPAKYDNQGFESAILIDSLRYIDFSDPPMDLYDRHSGVFDPHLIKRISFSHEQEIRIHTHLSCGWGSKEKGMEPEVDSDYIVLPCALDQLIQKIIIAPQAPNYYRDFICSLVDRFGFAIPIEDSQLAAEPIYRYWAGGIFDPQE